MAQLTSKINSVTVWFSTHHVNLQDHNILLHYNDICTTQLISLHRCKIDYVGLILKSFQNQNQNYSFPQIQA